MTNVAALISILTTTNLEPVVSFEPVTNLQVVIRELHLLHYQGVSNVVFATNWVHHFPVAPQQFAMPMRGHPSVLPASMPMPPMLETHHYHTNTVTNKVFRLAPAPPPLPGMLVEGVRTNALKPLKATAPILSTTILTNRGLMQIWLSRGTNPMPDLPWLPLPSRIAKSSGFAALFAPTLPLPGAHGIIHRVLPVPTEPAIWLEADWTGTPYGNLDIQLAPSQTGPWRSWMSVNASQWVYDPNGVLRIGWQISDDAGNLLVQKEFMRLVVAPP